MTCVRTTDTKDQVKVVARVGYERYYDRVQYRRYEKTAVPYACDSLA